MKNKSTANEANVKTENFIQALIALVGMLLQLLILLQKVELFYIPMLLFSRIAEFEKKANDRSEIGTQTEESLEEDEDYKDPESVGVVYFQETVIPPLVM